MSKRDDYRHTLQALPSWDDFLRRESGLPGPRGNLELAQAVADLGDAALFERYLKLGPERAPENTPDAFLAFCGVVGLGRLLAEGETPRLSTLHRYASDPRWRLREAVAMALQRWGDADMDALLAAMAGWAQAGPFEQRAAVAALCEPRLLAQPRHARAVLDVLHAVTTRLAAATDRKAEGFKVLRQGLAYAWSVAVAALPAEGKRAFERWLSSPDPDVRWVLRENLQKNRLIKMDPAWVHASIAQLAQSTD